MRHESTAAENKFWWQVRNRGLRGYKFKRQVPIGKYIVDFICVERRLIVEIDGAKHRDRRRYDKERDAFLSSHGFHVIRFWNGEVLDRTDKVLKRVLYSLNAE